MSVAEPKARAPKEPKDAATLAAERLARATEAFTAEVKSLRGDVARMSSRVEQTGARVDVLLTRVAAFSERGSVLILQRDLGDDLVPGPRPGDRVLSLLGARRDGMRPEDVVALEELARDLGVSP